MVSAKATGETVYADDLALLGMLHAKTLRSPHASSNSGTVNAVSPCAGLQTIPC